MSIKFGWSGDNKRVKSENGDQFDGALVLIMKALEGKRRQFEFSNGAIETMGIFKRTNGLEEQPTFSGTTISKAKEEETDNFFLFVNDGNFPDTKSINIHKTNYGFSDKETYEFLAKHLNLDIAKDNYISLEEYPQDIVTAKLFKIAGVYAPQAQLTDV